MTNKNQLPYTPSKLKESTFSQKDEIVVEEKDNVDDLVFKLGKVTLEIENLNKVKQEILDKLSNF